MSSESSQPVSRFDIARELKRRTVRRIKHTLPAILATVVVLLAAIAVAGLQFYFLDHYSDDAFRTLVALYNTGVGVYGWVWSRWYLRIPLQTVYYGFGLLVWWKLLIEPLYRWFQGKWKDARESVQGDAELESGVLD